jgi:hypothetical protein
MIEMASLFAKQRGDGGEYVLRETKKFPADFADLPAGRQVFADSFTGRLTPFTDFLFN